MDRVIAWELEVYGSHGMAAHEYPAMLARIASGDARPVRLVGRRSASTRHRPRSRPWAPAAGRTRA